MERPELLEQAISAVKLSLSRAMKRRIFQRGPERVLASTRPAPFELRVAVARPVTRTPA